LQQEQLDWLHNQHEELVEQTRLLRIQTDALQQIASHVNFFHVLAIIWLVCTGIGIFMWITIIVNAAR
jgi:hypothetical protein